MFKKIFAAMALFSVVTPVLRAEDADPPLGGNLLDVIDKGGFIMVIILISSTVGLAVAFERIFNLRRKNLCPDEFLAAVKRGAESRDWKAIDKEISGSSGPLVRILTEGLKHRDHGPSEVERAMESAGGHEVARLKRPVRPLAVLATVQPLLGLLGTIVGMIATFNLLGDTSPADRVEKLAPGIGQALYTTAAGLSVAIPFVVLYHFLIGKVNRAAEEWSTLGSTVVLALREAGAGKGKAA